MAYITHVNRNSSMIDDWWDQMNWRGFEPPPLTLTLPPTKQLSVPKYARGLIGILNRGEGGQSNLLGGGKVWHYFFTQNFLYLPLITSWIHEAKWQGQPWEFLHKLNIKHLIARNLNSWSRFFQAYNITCGKDLVRPPACTACRPTPWPSAKAKGI